MALSWLSKKSHPSSVFVRSIEIEIGDGNSIWLARSSHSRFELTEAMAYKATRQYSTDLCNFSENIHTRLSVWATVRRYCDLRFKVVIGAFASVHLVLFPVFSGLAVWVKLNDWIRVSTLSLNVAVTSLDLSPPRITVGIITV